MSAEPRDFPKRFAFAEAEPRITQRWLDARAFRSAYSPDGTVIDADRKDAEPFVIVIPPPNITGRLHMGHALNNTMQDVLTRYKRMDGYDALWIPGTDHAGIATQTVVKKHLDAEGVDFRELGRDEFIERVWEWRKKYGDAILNQLRRMGCSCDWSRTRFTMDDGLNRAVREAFCRLYEDGLIYRGKRIVNWCPVDQTALSDDEVEKEEEKGKMYYIRYPFADDASQFVLVATTRPETLFGDVAVAVHPKDSVRASLIGKKLRLPLQGRIIPIIGDEHADPEKGSGAVKITPAHDPNDFEVGHRHGLPQVDIMHGDATLNDEVPEAYRGLARYAARRKALEELESLGLLDRVEDHMMAVGRSYRSKEPIEFRLSDQWFVKMEPLAKLALEASGYTQTEDGWKKERDGGLALHPDRYEKVYFYWLSNIRDWCISRQIWWGHRIPAWHHRQTQEILVSRDVPEPVRAEPDAWIQDPDVLDTWFSSWLWPMSVSGWPERTQDFERYFPTSVLSTAKDIIFFWVARMNFAGLQFERKLPYRDVYLHSTIADETGVTMSKSKGNGIDPLTIIDGATCEELKQPVLDARPSNIKQLLNRIEKNYPNGFEAVGADAMRWTLVFSVTEGERVRLSLGRFTEGRNFITKLWNGAGRVITAIEAEGARTAQDAPVAAPTDEDRWLLARLDTVTRSVRKGLDSFDFGKAAQDLYHFVWNEFCSWALELSKTRLGSEDEPTRRGALAVMGTTLTDLLRLLHPVIPFVTEELWARLRTALEPLDGGRALGFDRPPVSELLARDGFVSPRNAPQPEIEARFEILQRFVVAVRRLRSESRVKDSERLVVLVKPLHEDTRPMLERADAPVRFLARLDEVRFVEQRQRGWAAAYDPAFELYLDLAEYVDVKAELARLDKDLAKANKELEGVNKTLANPKFVDRAPPDKVAATQEKKAEVATRIQKLERTRAELRDITSA